MPEKTPALHAVDEPRRPGCVPWRVMTLAVLWVALAALPAVAAAPPSSILRLSTADRSDVLTVRVGQPVSISLDLPGGDGWTEANIGHFVVRTYGRQESVATTPAAGAEHLAYTFKEPGWAMIILSAGPASEKGKSDSWNRTTHCTKLVVRVEPNGVEEPNATAALTRDPGLTAKAGERIEVLPLIAPTRLRLGADLPVRVYLSGSKQAGASVRAFRPDGSIETRTTDAVGTTFFRITQAGRWLIRYEAESEGVAYVGDLVFDVPGAPSEGGEAP